jgi:ergosteryl-3beta-O-L-aspartate synthase
MLASTMSPARVDVLPWTVSKLEPSKAMMHSRTSTDTNSTEATGEVIPTPPSHDSYLSQLPDNEMISHLQELSSIAAIQRLPAGSRVSFRARIHTQRRLSSALDFVLFRDQTYSIQGVLERHDKAMVKWVQHIPQESLVQVTGILQEPVEPVRSATFHGLEVAIWSIYLVSPARAVPFDNYKPPEAMRQRLANRVLDLRHPSNQALFRIRSRILREWRNVLEDQAFVEINTPKLQGAATESGASVFKVGYFGRDAFLAQSPQLGKQMAISADFGRVFEIGPVFRAENSNTHRHLTEYTGLDIEMTIKRTYHEIMDTVDSVLKSIFAAIQSMPELQVVRERWPSADLVWLDKTPVLTFSEAIDMLREDGMEIDEEDLSTAQEIRLGQLVKEKLHTDYYIIDKFPASVRPFYTHKSENANYTNSFDIFVRGQEICTGGQRIHDPEELRKNMADHGIGENGMADYLSAFDLGAPPHGGAGIGLERILMLVLELGDVRYATLWHRDPKSLPPLPPSLRHPDADTTRQRDPGAPMPLLEDLIANYGDATNTSWLDDRFEVWRHPTGAAIGYSRQSSKLVIVTGDPLCDQSQHTEVISDFLKFVDQELKLRPVWILVSEDVQSILAENHGWRTLACTEEQRIIPERATALHGRATRRAEREGVTIHEVRPTREVVARTNPALDRWRAHRDTPSKRVRLTEVRPWADAAHRRYFLAEGKGGTGGGGGGGGGQVQVHGLVVMAQLAPRHGWQVKWALHFPDAPNGTVEALVDHALANVAGPVTFGVGVSERLVPGAHMNGARAKFLARAYKSIVETLGLARKAEFREKFGVLGEQVYICYPKNGVSVLDLKSIIKFFEG